MQNAKEHEDLLLKKFSNNPYGPETGDGYSEFRSLSTDELREARRYFDSIEYKRANQG